MRIQGQGHIRQRGKQSWLLKFDLGRDASSESGSRATSPFVVPSVRPRLNSIDCSIAGTRGPTSIAPK